MREDALIKPLDSWIARLFRPEHREATIAAMMVPVASAQRSTEHDQARILIGECERKLDQYRRASVGLIPRYRQRQMGAFE